MSEFLETEAINNKQQQCYDILNPNRSTNSKWRRNTKLSRDKKIKKTKKRPFK